MRSRKVLILASEPMLAAFLGMMLELDSFEPVFAEPGEHPEDALTRVRPLLVILLHSELDAARSDLFFARAARSGASIVLFGSPASGDGPDGRDLRALAQERKVRYFGMPIDRSALAEVMNDVVREAPGSAGRVRTSTDRRVQPRAYDAPDGTFCLTDDAGQVWRVYDRRGQDRRAHPAPTTDADYRVFVSESGEERRYRPRARESLEISINELMRQLAEAEQVST